MSLLFLIAKSLLIILFLVMFLRSNKPAWGIGLLTVTSAILLDTLLGTLGRAQMLEELGFFFYIIAGALFAGATIWLWAIIKDFAFTPKKGTNAGDSSTDSGPVVSDGLNRHREDVVDIHRPIIDGLQGELSHDDLLDLIFDLGWFDEDLTLLQGENNRFINSIIGLAEDRGQLESLKLASKRIITPIPPENLPRLEKLKQDSPPTLLRHFLLANYTLVEVEQMIEELDVDDDIGIGKLKNSNVRYLLSDLYQKNRIGALIELMQQSSGDDLGHER
jgi:hypothetical protein